MRFNEKPQETNKDWQPMFNVQKLLFKNVKYFGLFMWAVPSMVVKLQKSDYFSHAD